VGEFSTGSIGAVIGPTVYDFEATTIDGRPCALAEFRGRVLLVVNVASHCRYTPQYAVLERLHRTYARDGLVVLGFPFTQFGRQEPGTAAEIQAFASTCHAVTFPLFAKVEVNGSHAHPLFEFLTSSVRGVLGSRRIKWNFTKFLVGRDGRVLARYGAATGFGVVEAAVRQALACAGQLPHGPVSPP
jgi:glutathione peroxidase